ncbi:hypothetical protein E0Z10_g5812 [Xylaria hypoxylon]|uniref:Uncharacterized protein n=1 Tax=Xylaria hypoxylon TaxID=37992 RepID=A0A4Z0YU75_9PEZI|nr:hypothetical protein E0Z10_g5812 [Xylaria hypoxylon]
MPPTLNELIRAYCSGITPSGGQIARRLLTWGRGRQCTDPRDRVYGIFGLLSEPMRTLINVDYTKPVSHAYIEMAMAEVEVSKQLGFLKECFLGSKMPGIPSWVPNLSPETASSYESRTMYQRWHSATLNSAAVARFVDPDVLEVEGVHCGIVSSLGPRVSETPADRLKSFIAWQTLTAQLPIDGTATAQLDACLYLLLGGFIKRSVIVDLAEVRSLYPRAVAGDITAFDTLLGFMNIHYPINETGTYFLTDTGYVGPGPEEVQSGPSAGTFTVVGPCIVGGLMSGESLRGPLPEQWTMIVAGHHESGDYKGHYITFRNSASDKTSLDDPRIPPLSTDWEATRNMNMPGQTGWYHNCYRNKQTGKVESFDPTLLPQTLRDQGINVEVFRRMVRTVEACSSGIDDMRAAYTESSARNCLLTFEEVLGYPESGRRDGFQCAFGKFYATPGCVERVQGSVLRASFLPKLTPAGNEYLRDSYGDHFVRSQLKHYGVQFDDSEITGNGTQLLEKVLQAGKCDQVPPHITELRDEMHTEWLAQLTPEEFLGHPEWIMERYFLTSGQPDRAKTTMVVGFPFDSYSSHRPDQLVEAAGNISRLHHATSYGSKTQMVFIGWDSAAVGWAAKSHSDNEAEAIKAADTEREVGRSELHDDYLKALARKNWINVYSPVGTYIVDCKEIEEQWPDEADDLSLDIRAADEPGIYKASFDFGMLEGVMIIGEDEMSVERYCSQLDGEGDDEEDSSKDERKSGSKRKYVADAPKFCGRGRLPKKAKSSASRSRKYHLKLRCAETMESMIHHQPEDGTITFTGENMASFTGEASFPSVGTAVTFTARKTSDSVHGQGNSWSDYSETAYEEVLVGRWY